MVAVMAPIKIEEKNTFVHYTEPPPLDAGRFDARTWPDILRTPSEQDRAAAQAFYSDGRKRYETCKVSEIPFQPCPCVNAPSTGSGCGQHCRPFWRNVFKSEVKKLAECDRGKPDAREEDFYFEAWCPRANCDKCHSKACWPDIEFYRKTMRGKGGKLAKAG